MTDARRVCIAVDGGGSKTTVVCHDLSGAILGRARSGATNANSVGDANAEAALRAGILDSISAAGRTTDDVAAVCLGMSGVDRPDDKRKVAAWLERILGRSGVPALIYNDGTIALSCGTRGVLEGVVVISGTGTISLGYSLKGCKEGEAPKYIRAAGWGPQLGDEGSGYDIGNAVLKACVFADDGRGPKTALCGALLKKLQLSAMQELIKWAYDKETFSWQKIADVAPLAAQCAAEGDEVARGILSKAEEGLLLSISAVATRLGYTAADDLTVVYAGGLLSNGILSPGLTARIAKAFPKAKVVSPDIEPVMGAVFLNVAQKPWEKRQ